MQAARYWRISIGILPGSVAVFLTYHLGVLFQADAGLVLRALKVVGVALVVPGLIAGILMGNIHSFHLWVVATINLLFWFGFGWLMATFVSQLVKLRRAIAAVK